MRDYGLMDICPGTSPVQIGDRVYRVGQLTVGDMAELTRVVRDLHPHPYEAIRDDLDGLPEDERKAALQKAYAEASSHWGATLGDGLFSAALATREGISALIALVVLPNNEISVSEVVDLIESITPEEYSRVCRAAHNRDPHHDLEILLLGDDEVGDGGRVDWAFVIDEVSNSKGWTYDYIATLTLTQLAIARNGVKRRQMVQVASPAAALEMFDSRRAALFGGN